MTRPDELIVIVRRRAGDRCEYCRMHQSLPGATFHVDHVLPRVRGGPTVASNLAWACPGCNLRKSDRVEAVDPESGATAPLFHPRRDLWAAHFRWDGVALVATTPIGRATASLLDLNHPRRLQIRRAEAMFDLFSG